MNNAEEKRQSEGHWHYALLFRLNEMKTENNEDLEQDSCRRQRQIFRDTYTSIFMMVIYIICIGPTARNDAIRITLSL